MRVKDRKSSRCCMVTNQQRDVAIISPSPLQPDSHRGHCVCLSGCGLCILGFKMSPVSDRFTFALLVAEEEKRGGVHQQREILQQLLMSYLELCCGYSSELQRMISHNQVRSLIFFPSIYVLWPALCKVAYCMHPSPQPALFEVCQDEGNKPKHIGLAT